MVKRNRIYLVVVTLVLFVTILLPSSAKAESCPAGYCISYSGTNSDLYDYSIFKQVITSYLLDTGEGYLRFQKLRNGETYYLVQYYDYSFSFLSERRISQELPTFGAFYDDGTYYYVLSGQSNWNVDNSVETMRLTKYSHNFDRLSQLSMSGNNTLEPFYYGTARMVNDSNLLFIRTSHRMYGGHQANMQLMIDTNTMELKESLTEVSDASKGYLSHSFNQFIILDEGRVVGCDQSDGLPRSINFSWYKNTYTESSYGKEGGAYCVDLLNIPGSFGDNVTNCSVGGFVKTCSRYMAVGNCTDFSNYGSSSTRNIFVATCIIDGFVKDKKIITSYTDGTEGASTPFLVDLKNDTYLLMWTRGGDVYSCVLDNEGNAGEIRNSVGRLSDCEPILKDGCVEWYVWENERVIFYTLDVSTGDITNKALVFGHQYSYSDATLSNPYITKVCVNCGDKQTMKASTDFDLYISKDGYSYNICESIDMLCNEKLSYFMWDKCFCDYSTLEIVSSDPDIISYEAGEFKVGAKEGSAVLTFSIAHFPQMYRTLRVTVSHNYDMYMTDYEYGHEVKYEICSRCGVRHRKSKEDSIIIPIPEPVPEHSPVFEGVSLYLYGKIGVSIYVSGIPGNAVPEIECAGSKEIFNMGSDVQWDFGSVFFVCAKDMGEKIHIRIRDEHGELVEFDDGDIEKSFTVYDYIGALKRNTNDDDLKELCDLMEAYGRSAAYYFKSEGEVSEDIEIPVLTDNMVVEDYLSRPSEDTSIGIDIIKGRVEYIGCSLILSDDITLRIYFNQIEECSEKTATVNGRDVCINYVEGTSLFYVDISDIWAMYLTREYEVIVGKCLKVSGISPITYISRAVASDEISKELKMLCVSLYYYCECTSKL